MPEWRVIKMSGMRIVASCLCLWFSLTLLAQSPPAPLSLPQCSRLPIAIQRHGTAVVGRYAYVMGGNCGNDSWKCTVYHAGILPNGKLAEWKSGEDMPEGSFIGGPTEVVGDRIYIAGNPTRPKPSLPGECLPLTRFVFWARALPDGSLSPWKPSDVPAPALSCVGMCSSEKQLFLTGGRTSDRVTDQILAADFAPEGAPANWHTTRSLPIPLWSHCAVALKNRIYVWGGLTTFESTSVNALCFSAAIGTDGAIGEWRQEQKPPSPTHASACCGYNDYLITVGGRYGSGAPTNSIWYARVDKGIITNWRMVNTNLDATVLHSLGLDKTGKYVYVTGGQKKTKADLYSEIPLSTVQAFALPQNAGAD